MAVRRVHLLVSGRVQGVFFRSGLRDQAERLGLTGWVRNLPDGRLEAQLQGPAGAVKKVVAFAAAGPEQAQVDDFVCQDIDPVDSDVFSIQ